ncbi:DUF6507 family protein [Streptomyces albus]|uniref:DUF6507 family protein n=1 Tax=Streptomyces albus TaxID=1888 RepID=UPI0004C85962|nr:DUF6507 family protein [Streptomyces albus]
MTKWDIDSAGVGRIVGEAGRIAGHFEGELKSIRSHLESAMTAAGALDFGGEGETPEVGLVGMTLGQYFTAQQSDIAFIVARAGKSLQGAVDATKAYSKGDLDMAANAQNKALKAPHIDVDSSGKKGAK